MMIETAKTITPGRRGQRNSLLIRTLFDSCLRISECLSLRPCDISQDGEGYLIQVLGKGRNKGKVSVCAVSPQTVAQINSYCYENNIGKQDAIFDISRSRLSDRSRPSIKNPASGSRPYFETTPAQFIASGTAAQSTGSHFPVILGQLRNNFGIKARA